jgi:hypothetical protein
MAARCVTASIPHLVPMEVIERFVSTLRMRTNVAMMGIEAIINVAMEVVRAMKPGASPEEYAAVEPLGSVVPVGRAIVWSEVVVAVRTNGLCPGKQRRTGNMPTMAVVSE